MIALTDSRANEKSICRLESLGFEVMLMPPSTSLQAAVASHTDMLVFIGFGRLFCHVCYYEANKYLIDSIAQAASLNISLSHEEWSQNYPHDVLFNACLVGNRLICNTKTVSKYILDEARKAGAEIVNVSQGYTKCSICIVSENAVITSDRQIANACKNVGIDVLLISEGHISLPPYDFGFIGGTSGMCGDSVYFCGSLSRHPDKGKINEFCTKHGQKTIPLSDGILQDVGSIMFIGE